ncbi:MBL fold metallo-hydrolase, partial [Bifidobacterium longum]|nr:MBL fold metallo-hydrolase [Bifidobacterium longum]
EAGELAKSANVKKLVLTHLPQFGDLEQLKNEAQKAAGKGIDVELAAVDKVFNI